MSIENITKIAADKVFLVYVSEKGEEWDQLASDVVCSGTLVDPETGDDMELEHVVIDGAKVDLDKIFLIYFSENGEEFDQPVGDVTSVGTLIDPELGDDMEVSHVEIVQ